MIVIVVVFWTKEKNETRGTILMKERLTVIHTTSKD